MSPRRFGLSLVALGTTTALVWGSLGLTVRAQEAPAKIARAHSAQFPPTFEDPIFILLLGGDARGSEGSEYGGHENPDKVRMDSIHIMAIDPTTKRASLLGIPRDSYVDIPGRGRNKINAAGMVGGTELMLRTVEDLSACRFDYYTLTSFKGFTRVVNDLGGFPFTVNAPVKDKFAKIDLAAGRQHFDGTKALGWARSRKSRPQGDFDRSREQGALMIAALTEARDKAGTDVGVALRSLATLRRNLKLNIPADEAFRLGLLMLQIEPSNVTNIVVDGFNAKEDGSAIVRITDRGREQLVDICDDGQLGS